MRWSTLLVAAAASALVETVPFLRQVCTWSSNKSVDCSCSPQFPVIDVVSSDTGFLKGAVSMTVRDCPAVKFAFHTLEKTDSLHVLRLSKLTRVEFYTPLPYFVRELYLSDIGELSTSSVIFQVIRRIEKVFIRNVTMKELEAHFFDGVSFSRMDLRDSKLPSLWSHSLHITADTVMMDNNRFRGLNRSAITIESKSVNITNNFFENLDNYSIQWEGTPNSKLIFDSNTIRSLQKGALAGILGNRSSTVLTDNVVECHGDFQSCKTKVILNNGQKVCDAENICRYRNRAAMRALVPRRGCATVSLSEERCALLVVKAAASAIIAGLSTVAAAFVTALLIV